MSTSRGVAAAFLLVFACAPQPVDRVTADGAVTLAGGSGGRGGAGGAFDGATAEAAVAAGGSGGSFDATGGAGGRLDATPDRRPPDLRPVPMPDAPPPPVAAPDTAPPDLPPPMPDSAPEAPQPQVVQLVVGDTGMLGPGDTAVRTVLTSRLPGFTVRLRDDGAALDLVNTRLYVIAGSVESGTVGNRYRDVPVPVISLEYSLFDNMGLTGITENTDFGVTSGTQIAILDPLHPLAAGLSGTVTITTQSSNMSWGNPSDMAIWIATLATMPTRAAIFAYPPGAQLRGLVAPAKRIGIFALESSAARMTEDGKKLLGAAVDWALEP